MAKVLVTDTHLTDIANAIRDKNGTEDTYKPSEMANAIQGISTSEDLSSELNTQETLLNNQVSKLSVAINTLKNKASGGADTSEIEDAFITHTLSGDYVNDRVTKVKYGTFYEDAGLTSVSFPNVTSVESYAFYKCTSLATIDIPQIKSASQYTFAYTKPPIINFPLLETISTYTFAYITSPCSVNLPSLKTTSNSSFRDSKGITRVDLAITTKIDNLCFYYCTALETLILRKSDAICTLQNTNAFTGTPIAKGTGYIYVPNELVEEYKVATNWSTFANQIKPLSELEVVTNE